MPKKAKYERIRSHHFAWRLSRRGGVWYADGRTNPINVGRHSLGTRDKADALAALVALDEACAVKFGLIEKKMTSATLPKELPLAEGRRLYEEYIGRPRVTGGVKDPTKRRYRPTFDKFLFWALKNGVRDFRQVDADVLNRYAAYLIKKGYAKGKKQYAQKTLSHELTTLKQCVKWLIDAGHLIGCEPIKLKLRKAESQKAYCYKHEEVEAILQRCREVPDLSWIGNVVIGLACTGMRIEELANLKWPDVDLVNNRITLVDESGRGGNVDAKRTLKSGRSRAFPLYPELVAVLVSMPKPDAYVFHGPNGRRLDSRLVRQILVKRILTPLAEKFPAVKGGQSFIDGRLHSFRHYFISRCAAGRASERVVMDWVGHANSAMVRHYFHLHDEESQRQMKGLNLLGGAAGRSDGEGSKVLTKEVTPSR